MEDCLDEFDSLKAIIQCPLNVRKQADMELKKILITNIFTGGLIYTRDKGVQTPEIPLIYRQKSNIRGENIGLKKIGVQTYFSPVENGDIKKQELNLG